MKRDYTFDYLAQCPWCGYVCTSDAEDRAGALLMDHVRDAQHRKEWFTHAEALQHVQQTVLEGEQNEKEKAGYVGELFAAASR